MALYNVSGQLFSNSVLIAASNSVQADKNIATYVCTGTNDELTIQTAINAAKGEVFLAVGDYYIDSFPNTDGNGLKSALMIGINGETNIRISGLGYGTLRKNNTNNQITGGAIIHVSNTCYSSLDSSTQYAIIASKTASNGSRLYPYTKVRVEHLGFVIPDNQKKIICIDGWMMTSLAFNDILAMAVADASSASTLKIPVDGCIGVRGLQGSNFGVFNRWESSFMWGFYEGFAVSGEHIVGVDLGTRYCNYGFTFNRKTNGTGALTHPITLINCCDECNFNLPYFGNNGEYNKSDGKSGRQTINLIDYNLEVLSAYFSKGGAYATEVSQGNTYGSITFTTQPSYGGNSKNDVTAKFWATGYGNNVRTTNMAHSSGGTTAERETYTPQYLQQYYDTTLGKLLVYNGSAWKDMTGASV